MFVMNCYGPLMEMKFMWCPKDLEFAIIIFVDNLCHHFIKLHLEMDGDLCGHFFNPYITFNLEKDFDYSLNVVTFKSIVYPTCEVVLLYFL
jgi:hypothetical protein